MTDQAQYLLNEDLANQVLAYLARKPYVEVANMIEALRSLPSVKMKPEDMIPTTHKCSASDTKCNEKSKENPK